MHRRHFHRRLTGTAGALTALALTRRGGAAAPPGLTAAQLLRDKQRAVPYPKPTGQRNGFDSVDMHEVWRVQQLPAVRVKLEDAGKQQITLDLLDQENNLKTKTFNVLVIETTPCDTDTLIKNPTPQEDVRIKDELTQPDDKKQKNKTHKPPLFKIP